MKWTCMYFLRKSISPLRSLKGLHARGESIVMSTLSTLGSKHQFALNGTLEKQPILGQGRKMSKKNYPQRAAASQADNADIS